MFVALCGPNGEIAADGILLGDEQAGEAEGPVAVAVLLPNAQSRGGLRAGRHFARKLLSPRDWRLAGGDDDSQK